MDKEVSVSGVYLTRDATKIHLDANSRQKRIKILFAVSVFLFFSVFSASLPYNYCVQTDFPSSKPRFETLDQDYLLADELNRFEISRPSLLPTIPESTHSEKFLSSFQYRPVRN